MDRLTDRPPMSRTDKLCLLAIAGLMVLTAVVYELTDGRAIRAAEAEADKPEIVQGIPERLPLKTDAAVFYGQAPNAEFIPPAETGAALFSDMLAEALAARQEELYWQDVPLDQECRKALQEACEASGVPICLVLGVIETESGFQVDAVSSEGCYGLMQLNARWFPAGFSPEENIRAGVAHLGSLLDEYDGDTAAALTAYHAGSDTGSRTYSRRVLDASEKWGCG